MTYTLFDLTYRTARELGTVSENLATTGSATTVVDTVNLTQVDDYWNGGTVWILWDAADAGAAPEGKYGVISDFDNTTAAATFPTMTQLVATGDRYAIGKSRYTLSMLIQGVNRAIQELGSILPITGVANIQTTKLESSYAVPTTPTGVGNYDLKRVFMQRLSYADTFSDEPWIELKNWIVQTTTAGVPSTILFPYDLPENHNIKCMYCVPQPELNAYSDVMSATIPVEYVVYAAAANCLNTWRQKTKDNNQSVLDDIAYYRQKAMEYKIIQPVLFREKAEVRDDDDAVRLNVPTRA